MKKKIFPDTRMYQILFNYAALSAIANSLKTVYLAENTFATKTNQTTQ